MLREQSRALRLAALGLLALAVASTNNAFAADKPAMKDATGKLSYVRLYTTPDGASHFVNEEVTLAPAGGSGPEASLAVSRIGDVKGTLFASLKAGTTEDWHIAPRRQFMVCLRGIVEVTASDGEKRRFTPGQFLLLEDTMGKGHVTHSAGTEDHVALAVPLPDGVFAKK